MADSKLTGPYRLGYFVWAASVQSTFASNLFNEFRYGVQHSGDTNASATANYGTYNTYNNVPLRIGGSLPWGTMAPYIDQANVTGRHFITTMTDALTWIKGQHTVRAGFSFRQTVWKDVNEVFPTATYSTGTPSGDPIPGSMFTIANFPGILASSLPGGPASLWNQLVGRVSSTAYRTVVNPDTKQFGNFVQYNWNQVADGRRVHPG